MSFSSWFSSGSLCSMEDYPALLKLNPKVGQKKNGAMFKLDQKHTCFGGSIKVLTELSSLQSHGQSLFGYKVDLEPQELELESFRSWKWNWKARNSTWLKKADLLFVDNPVGTGYSFVEDTQMLVKTDEAATDLTTAINAGKLKLKLGGVALGNSWISPEDFVVSDFIFVEIPRKFADLNACIGYRAQVSKFVKIQGVEDYWHIFNHVFVLSDKPFGISISLAEKISQKLKDGQYVDATNTWSQLESVIGASNNSVDFYNFLKDAGMGPVALTASELSNGFFTMGGQAGIVFSSWAGDFMRPRIAEVDELLSKGVNVTIYSGQLDVICATKGTEVWIDKLKWEGVKYFVSKERSPLYCKEDEGTKGFHKSYKNLQFFWILGAGHFVPVEQPCVALDMAGAITQSPAAAEAS
ncbi:Geranyl diphosphate synthase 1 isoform 1 [Hibiscus syriacus]|uniref:Geranyl diphosphate synthase 1 isoform 1 n=1 Tax=Hibiscus syriacus TaxID=106335 RepID=A0A6A2YMP8_HIBSY|nr:Geranyl diphosphate synthase 1 isoform 1 [Hibiscus syriacus]